MAQVIPEYMTDNYTETDKQPYDSDVGTFSAFRSNETIRPRITSAQNKAIP